MCKAKGPQHSYAAANTLSLILHNVQVQNHLICSSHKTWRCYAHNLPNVRQVSIFHVRNSGGCSLSFVIESHRGIKALHQKSASNPLCFCPFATSLSVKPSFSCNKILDSPCSPNRLISS